MSIKLKDRINSYQEALDYKLINRLPIIIYINGRSFSKVSELLDKPYCPKFAECILSTTLKLCSEIEGCVFAYQYNDEIVIISRNDQNQETNAWYDNKLQKICSVASSIATMHFNNCANAVDLNLVGDAIFTSQVFVVPSISEAINTIIYKQQQNFHTSIQFACFYEFIKKYNKNIIKENLSGLNVDEKIDLLKQECDIDFNKHLPYFRRGAACYKAPSIINGAVKNKLIINTDIPIFTEDTAFLKNIISNGSDLFRK